MENNSNENKQIKPTSSNGWKKFKVVDKENNGSPKTGKKISKKTEKCQKVIPIELQIETNPEEAADENEARKLSECDLDGDWTVRLKWLHPRREVGLWIQCCRENCRKWRFNEDIHDPTDVPEIWYCDMHPVSHLASCNYPEVETPAAVEEDCIENKYTAGGIVWARLDGCPWWPAMIDDCPFNFRYYELQNASNVPIKYNVTWFQERVVQCSWISEKNIAPYNSNPKEVFLKGKRMTFGGVMYKDLVLRCCEMADEAMQLSIGKRLEKFSFVSRYSVHRNTNIQASNRTCPVKLDGRISKQGVIFGANSTSKNESTQQSTVPSTFEVATQQERVQRFTQQSVGSPMELYSERSVEGRRGVNRSPQIASDAERLSPRPYKRLALSWEASCSDPKDQPNYKLMSLDDKLKLLACNRRKPRDNKRLEDGESAHKRLALPCNASGSVPKKRPNYKLMSLDDKLKFLAYFRRKQC